ncbi:hypothetical protein [Sphingobacterium sp. SGG-5]|uniref:hypothetical protein n=1 Tax=Sphingobacterium sp. SGG-5 TaxID=2710881 RepID=UPI0019CFE475|nr:hypothetical protein [Sphingobacterium sp. SGG-5]
MSERFTMKKAIEMLEVSKTNMYQYFKSKNLSRETVKKITETFAVSVNEIWGDGTIEEGTKPNLWIVPFRSYAGFLRGYGDGLGTKDNIEKIYYPLIKGEAYAFQIGGQSAFPLFPENTWFCGKPVESADDLVKGRLYTWQTIDGIVTKLFDGMDDEYFYVSSVNKDFNPVKPFHRKSVKVIYRQVGKLDNFEY